MRYAVTFLAAGEERTARLDAPDAVTAAAAIEAFHGGPRRYGLLRVRLLDAPAASTQPPPGCPGERRAA